MRYVEKNLSCGEISDFDAWQMWRNLKFLHKLSNFNFFHMTVVQKSEISPHLVWIISFNIYPTNNTWALKLSQFFKNICLYLSKFFHIFVYIFLSIFFQHLSSQQHVGSQRIMPVWIPSNLVKFTFPASSGARRLFPNVTQAIILMKILASSQFEKLCS